MNKKKIKKVIPIIPKQYLLGKEVPVKAEFRHQIAIDILQRDVENTQMEIDVKHKYMMEILNDPGLDQSIVKHMGVRIRKMQIHINRLNRSIRLLSKNNKPITPLHTEALSDKKII